MWRLTLVTSHEGEEKLTICLFEVHYKKIIVSVYIDILKVANSLYISY
jgi:hypothetical protein